MVSIYAIALAVASACTQQPKSPADAIKELRDMSDDARAHRTSELALEIRRMSPSASKLDLAFALANVSTEGDFGHGPGGQVGRAGD